MTQEKQKEPATSSPFTILSKIDCSEHVEQKNGLNYLSWSWSWHLCKSYFPNAFYTIYEDVNGIPYFTDGRTAWVKTGVTIEGLEHIEYLPIMDYNNRSIPLDKITSTDMNKAIQRSLTKACARHGLGLYIYAGEDLPDTQPEAEPAPEKKKAVKVKKDEPAREGTIKVNPVVVEPAETALAAITAAEKAKSAEELVAVWSANKDKYGTDPNFILAISANPHNPKKR